MINKCHAIYCLDCYRGSRPEMFCRKGVLRNFAKFTEKHLCQSLFFNKVAGLRPTTLLKRRLQHNFPKFLRTFFLTEPLRWLLLLLDEIQNMKTRESKERKFEKEVKVVFHSVKISADRVSCFNIYIVVFAFLLSTVEVARWQKLNKMSVFRILFICLICLIATTFIKIFVKNVQK